MRSEQTTLPEVITRHHPVTSAPNRSARRRWVSGSSARWPTATPVVHETVDATNNKQPLGSRHVLYFSVLNSV